MGIQLIGFLTINKDMRNLIDIVEGRNWTARMQADFRAGQLTPDEFAEKWDENKRPYLYHGTANGNLETIRQNGLLPHRINEWTDIEPIWFAKDPETSDQYQGGQGNGALLRVLKQNVHIDKDYGGTCSTLTPVPAGVIDIEQPDGSWLPL